MQESLPKGNNKEFSEEICNLLPDKRPLNSTFYPSLNIFYCIQSHLKRSEPLQILK